MTNQKGDELNRLLPVATANEPRREVYIHDCERGEVIVGMRALGEHAYTYQVVEGGEPKNKNNQE